MIVERFNKDLADELVVGDIEDNWNKVVEYMRQKDKESGIYG